MQNRTKIYLWAGAALLSGLALTQSFAQTPAPAPAAQAAIVWQPGYIEPGLPRPPYMPANTPLGSGPYKAIMATETGAEEFVAFYPANLSALGNTKMPVLVWGNGSCTYRGNKFRHFLTEIASHGYFALGGGPMGAPDNGASETVRMEQNNALRDPDAPRAPAAPPDPNVKRVTVALLSQGIDWAIAENKRAGSKFFGKLDTANIAVMGQSCGGGLASNFGGDARVKTIGIWSSSTGGNAAIRTKLTQPVLLLSGDPRYDVAFYPALADFEAMDNAKLFYAWRNNLTHLGTYRQTDGGELSPIAVAWLDWQLKSDQTAAKMFTGSKCGLCTNKYYHVQRRNIN